jgi:hypothetical protein
MGNFDRAESGFNGSFDSASIFGNNSTADAHIGSGDQATSSRSTTHRLPPRDPRPRPVGTGGAHILGQTSGHFEENIRYLPDVPRPAGAAHYAVSVADGLPRTLSGFPNTDKEDR